MAKTPEEELAEYKRLLEIMKREAEEEAASSYDIDKPTTAKELLDVFRTAVGQSASMNLLDEIVAAGSDTTAEERAEANRMIEAERNRTLGTAAAGLAGDIVGAVPAGIGAARIAGAKALRLLGLGAAEGAITGAGAGETPEERLSGAAIGTVLGAGAAAAGVAAPKVVRALSSEKQAAEAIEQLARETAEAQRQKLASIRGTKQLAKEAKPTRFKVEEEEPGEFIELVEPEMPTSGAKIANPLIGLDEPAEITPVSAKIKELQKEIGPSIYKDIEKPLVTPVVGPIVSEDVAPISNELLRQFAEDVARRGKKTRPQALANVPEPIYREAVKRVNELMSTLTPERRATFTEANINNQIRNTISSIMQEQAEAIAPRLDYIERFRGMSEGNIRKTIVEETKDLIESGRIYVTPEDKVKFIEDRVQKILSEVEEAHKGSVGAMRATPLAAPGEFLGIKEKLPTETDRAAIATDYIKRRAREKNPDLLDDELPEVEYIPEERQMIVRDPLLPAAESTLVLDENGILKGQWQTEYTRPVGRGKTVTEKTKAFTATDALDAAMYTFGDAVKGLEGIWTKRKGLTTNTDEFEKTVNKLINSGLSREEAELDAYFATNTGRKMAKYGYTEVNPIEVDFDIVDGRPVYNEVRVQFLKPARKNLDEQAAVERGRKSSSASEMALEIAKQGLEEIKSGKPRGMAILPFSGKRKLKQLPEKTETSQTTAMVPSLSKQQMEVAARGPSITERLGKAGRSLQGALTVDEFRAERKILEDELNFAQRKLDMASTPAEIRAAERAQNAAYQKLNRFREEYPDVDDLMQLVNDLDRRRNAINTRFSRGDHLLGQKAADALTIDTQAMIQEQVAIAEKIKDVFMRYPELYDELPRSHPLIRAYEELPDIETPAFAESRGLMGRLEEMLGLKKR